MDQIEDVSQDFVQHKNEQCIQVKLRDTKIVLTNQVSIAHFVDILILTQFLMFFYFF